MPHSTTLLALTLFIAGCHKSPPPTPRTTSAQIPTLQQRIDFLNRHVTFRRTYESLDFDITRHNNDGGMIPGPSDYDIRLIATVPAAELQAWLPQGAAPAAAPPETDWLKSIPTSLNLSGVTEWYVEPRRIIGIDRTRRIVVYRAWAS